MLAFCMAIGPIWVCAYLVALFITMMAVHAAAKMIVHHTGVAGGLMALAALFVIAHRYQHHLD